MSEIDSEESQRQTEQRKFLEKRHTEVTERKQALEEVKRIRRMPKDQLQQWLEQPDER
jgi:hypothetical protein